jgi:hypothetical protein
MGVPFRNGAATAPPGLSLQDANGVQGLRDGRLSPIAEEVMPDQDQRVGRADPPEGRSTPAIPDGSPDVSDWESIDSFEEEDLRAYGLHFDDIDDEDLDRPVSPERHSDRARESSPADGGLARFAAYVEDLSSSPEPHSDSGRSDSDERYDRRDGVAPASDVNAPEGDVGYVLHAEIAQLHARIDEQTRTIERYRRVIGAFIDRSEREDPFVQDARAMLHEQPRAREGAPDRDIPPRSPDDRGLSR